MLSEKKINAIEKKAFKASRGCDARRHIIYARLVLAAELYDLARRWICDEQGKGNYVANTKAECAMLRRLARQAARAAKEGK